MLVFVFLSVANKAPRRKELKEQVQSLAAINAQGTTGDYAYAPICEDRK